MNGAREFYRIIKDAHLVGIGGLAKTQRCTHGGDSVAYQCDNVIYVTSTHARGKTFRIYLVDGENTLEVYGVVRGQRGWTEEYGWRHKGTWVKPILSYLRRLEREYAACVERLEEDKRKKQSEANRQKQQQFDKFNEMFREVSE